MREVPRLELNICAQDLQHSQAPGPLQTSGVPTLVQPRSLLVRPRSDMDSEPQFISWVSWELQECKKTLKSVRN